MSESNQLLYPGPTELFVSLHFVATIFFVNICRETGIADEYASFRWWTIYVLAKKSPPPPPPSSQL